MLPCILYAVDVTEPAQWSLTQKGKHDWNAGLLQDIFVTHVIFPGNNKDLVQAAKLEAVKWVLLTRG